MWGGVFLCRFEVEEGEEGNVEVEDGVVLVHKSCISSSFSSHKCLELSY